MAAADDKKVSGHSIETSNNPGAMASVGKLTTARIANVMATIKSNYSDSVYAGIIQRVVVAGRETPIGDADYATLPIGSIYLRDRVSDSTTQSGFDIYLKKASGSSGWYYIATAADAGQTIVTQAALADAAATLTAAQVLGGEAAITPTAARAITLPAAADLLALIPNAVVGTTIQFAILNLAAATHAVTMTASATITNGGRAGDFTVAAATTALYRIRFTNVTASSEAAVLVRV
jgi:hypothetical protein